MAEKASHILLIHLDQCRADCLSVYGNGQIKTPALDDLARDGRLYDNHFCSYPVCTPSRYSLISGLPVQDHRGWDNHCTLDPSLPSWPRQLSDKGYVTAAVGKMHYTPTYLDTGFDKMILCEQDGPGRWDDDYHGWLMERGEIDYLDIMDQRSEYRERAGAGYYESFGTARSNLSAQAASSGWTAARAMEVLEEWDDNPRLLMVGFVKPHHPFDPPAPWDGLYNPEEMELLPGWTDEVPHDDYAYSQGYFDHKNLTMDRLRKVQAAYYGNISEIDHYVGEMTALLKKKNLYERTMIIFTSDHGDYMGYHHMLLKGNHMYDPLMRIPLVIKYPQSTNSGRCSQLSSNTDLYDTLMKEGNRLEEGREYVFAHTQRGVKGMARSKSHKLLFDNREKGGFLFDLISDPCEKVNRWNDPDCREIRETMLAALMDWQKDSFETEQTPYLDYEAPARLTRPRGFRKNRIDYYEDSFSRKEKEYGM